MREIKFRQFIGDSGFHYWGNGPHEDGAKWKGPCSDGGGGKKYPSYQYTGLKDKNGVEIYEGDIVKYKGYIVSRCQQVRPDIKFEVTRDIPCLHRLYCLCESPNNMVVEKIGTIHENSELLK